MKKYIYCVSLIAFAATISQAEPISSTRLARQVNRSVSAAQRNNDQLIDSVSNTRVPPAQMRTYLRRGADPCRALSVAIFANNVPAIRVLAEFKGSCNWNDAVSQRLPLVIRKEKNEVFDALMETAPKVTCPDPFNYTPSPNKVAWQPLSATMLDSVNKQCFKTRQAKSNFLRDLMLLNPNQRTIFSLAESYTFGIHSEQVKEQWLASVEQLVKAGSSVSNDTLLDVIARGRANTYEGFRKIPFDATRTLVKQSLKGGANGKEVLAYLDSSKGEWVWEMYSAQERMRLSNILENKPEMQSRTWLGRFWQRIAD